MSELVWLCLSANPFYEVLVRRSYIPPETSSMIEVGWRKLSGNSTLQFGHVLANFRYYEKVTTIREFLVTITIIKYYYYYFYFSSS